MDGLKHPIGEQTPNVYWRRRVAVIAAIVVLGLLVWWILGALSSDSATPGASNTVDPTVSTSPTNSAVADPGRDCTADDFAVASGPDNATFTGNDAPTFTVTVTSTSDTPCMVDPTKDSKIVVASGDVQWFDSTKCTAYTVYDAEKFLLDTGATHDLATSWNRGRDDAGCSTTLVAATKGYFWITATVQGVSAKKLQFQVG